MMFVAIMGLGFLFGGVLAELLLGSFATFFDMGYPRRRYAHAPDTALKLYSGRVLLLVSSALLSWAVVTHLA